MKVFLGIDVGSVTAKIAALREDAGLIDSVILNTKGLPTQAVREGFTVLSNRLPEGIDVVSVGVTGSARKTIAGFIGADVIKNEIICQAQAAIKLSPQVKTVIEIGGQDSKLIIIRDKVVVDFSMNTICAAGTGSFLDHQAQRLGIRIEDFGDFAVRAKSSIEIAGRCTVFAESDMIYNAQKGVERQDILAGLCRAIARNYLNNLAKGKQLLAPVLFLGGVAANIGVKKALEQEAGCSIIVPDEHKITGAIGACLSAQEEYCGRTNFRGFEIAV